MVTENPDLSLQDATSASRRKIRPWREMGVLSLMLMGLSWGIPWFRSLTQATNRLSTGYAFFVFGSMMLTAYLFVRLMNLYRVRANIRKVLMLGLLVISVFVGLKALLFLSESVTVADLTDRQLNSFSDAYSLIPDEFIITVGVLLVWRRGSKLANENIGPRLIQSAFGTGIFMFFFFVFMNTFVTGETPGNMPVLFIFSGLLAMGSARVAALSSLRGGRENPFDRRWMTGMLVSVLGAVGIASWLGAEVSGGEGILGLMPRLILGGLVVIAFLLLTPIFMLLYWGLYVTVTVLQTDNSFTASISETMGLIQGLAQGAFAFLAPYFGPFSQFMARFGILTKTLILWLVVFGLVLMIILMVYIQDKRRRTLLREQYERITDEGLLNSLRASLRQGIEKSQQALSNLFDFDRRRRLLAAARIRRIYGNLMDLCDELDVPRPVASTPSEFVHTMEDLFTECQADVDLITRAYEEVRYGELPENQQIIQQVEQAWNRIKRQGESLRKSHAAA